MTDVDAMDSTYLARLVNHLRRRGIAFEQGLALSEVARVESTYGFRFPPDLGSFLEVAVPVSEPFPNWRHGSEADLQRKLAWPLEGMLFDIEHNVFWYDSWGPKPSALSDAFAIARREVAKAPTLIPVYSHRYVPCEPELAGNPVFSVHQTDIIYYGNDLASYFNHEFGAELPPWAATERRHIKFWTDLVEYTS